MFRYYKILFGYNKFYFSRDEGPNSLLARRTLETRNESSEWKKSKNLVADRYLSAYKGKTYEVYIKQSNKGGGLIDIKINGFFGNPIIYGVPENSAQKAVGELMKLNLATISGREFVWKNSKIELIDLRENIDKNDCDKMQFYADSFAIILGLESKLFAQKLEEIDYLDLKNLLNKVFAQENPSEAYLQARLSLSNSIDSAAVVYDNMKKSGVISENQRFEELRKFKFNLINNLVNQRVIQGVNFVESFESMTLNQLLTQYQNNAQDEGKRYLILQKIISKFVNGEQKFLAYGENGQILIKASRVKNGNREVGEAEDNNSREIISLVSQEDLKGIILRDIIKSLGINIGKENINYEFVITEILKKYNIGGFVGLDVINRPGDLEKAIESKLKGTSNINEIRDLNFVLDYIINKNSYPNKMFQESAARSMISGSSYDPNTKEGLGRLKDAAEKGVFVETLFKDIRSSYGGTTGALIMIGTIIGLFIPKWRKYAIGSILAQILGPAGEELLHKWGFGKFVSEKIGEIKDNIPFGSSQESKTNSSSRSGFEVRDTSDIDFIVLNLPQKYTKIYNKMYRENLKKPPEKRIYQGDFAQIFAQLAQNKDFKSKGINQVQQAVNAGRPVSGILGSGNIPKNYKDDLVRSKSGQEISGDRTIQEKDVEKFINLLLSVGEADKDQTIGDLFVEGKDELEYMDKKIFQTENSKIQMLVDSIPFGEARTKVEEVLGETRGFFASLDTNEKKKEKISEIIQKLRLLQTQYTSEQDKIGEIIGVYEEIGKKLDVQISFDNWKKEATEAGELGPGMEFVNTFKDKWSAMIGFFKLSSSLNLDSLSGINLTKLDKYIKKGKELLEKDGISEKQKIEINQIIKKLREKKLAVLRSKDRLGTSPGTMSDETKDEFKLLIEENKQEYEDKINSINLETKPYTESMDSYRDLFLKNAENIIFLQSIVDSGSSLAGNAKEKLDTYNDEKTGFIPNLKKYIETKTKKLTEIETSVSSLDLDGIQAKIDEFEIIKKEFIDDGGYITGFKDFIKNFGYEDINSDNNKIIDFQNRYNRVLGTTIDLKGEDFKTQLDNAETAISGKLTELIGNEPLPIVPNSIYNNNNQNIDSESINSFIDSAKAYKDIISKFRGTNSSLVVDDKLHELNQKIGELEDKFIEQLKKDGASDDTKLSGSLSANAILNDSWKSISERLKKDLGYNSTKFKNAYDESVAGLYIFRISSIKDFDVLVKLKSEFLESPYKDISKKGDVEKKFKEKEQELAEKKFIEELKKLRKEDIPDEIEKILRDLVSGRSNFFQYTDFTGRLVNRLPSDSFSTAYELIEKLVSLREDLAAAINSGNNYNINVNDMNKAIYRIVEILKKTCNCKFDKKTEDFVSENFKN